MKIIPAIDLIDAKCVRLTQGDYNQKTIYNEDPLEVAKEFEGAGLTRLHLVDLDGAKAKKVINWKVLERIANNTSLVIDFGGGVRTNEDLEVVFNSGAAMVTAGSIAVTQPDTVSHWLARFGADKIILGADVKGDFIAIHGWQEKGTVKWPAFIEDYTQKGITQVICTDVAKDGMLQGPSIGLYKDIMAEFPKLQLIASGGVSNMHDLHQLNEIGVAGTILGKAIYEGRVTLKELSSFV
jgi:phosphoribosylformimino-5-aminoimidazole carboxamide ribotide isomerase